MRILWATLDRSSQTISHFENLRYAVANIADVTTVIKSQRGLESRAFADSIFSGKVKDEILLDKYDEKDFDFIVADALFAWPGENWKRFRIPKAYITEDLHEFLPRKQKEIAIKSGFNILFARYFEALKKMHPEVFNYHRCIWLPHSVPISYFQDFFSIDNKPVDILLAGSVTSYYPFRQYVEKVFSGRKNFKRVKRVRGPRENDINPIGMEYLMLLNSAKCAIACGAKVEYTVCKYAEIPAAGSMIVSPHFKELGNYGFIDGQNIVIANQSNVEDKINYYLKNDKERYKITTNGREMIRQNHTCDIRAKQFIKHLEEF